LGIRNHADGVLTTRLIHHPKLKAELSIYWFDGVVGCVTTGGFVITLVGVEGIGVVGIVGVVTTGFVVVGVGVSHPNTCTSLVDVHSIKAIGS
jgi:hypothetical protein